MTTSKSRPFVGRRFVLPVLGLALVVGLLVSASRSQAAELVFWNNYQASPQSISSANIDGTGGGPLNLTGTVLDDPEGMAIDTATGRLFVASSGGGPTKTGQILAVNLDGSGAAVFSAPGAPVDEPFGVVVDPVTRMIYWANYSETAGKPSIAWARLDGTAGGTLNTTGATLNFPYKIGLDPVNGRVYWGNTGVPGGGVVISFANANNTGGGGDLNLGGYKPESAYAFAVDPAAGRLYWSDGSGKKFVYTGLLGGVVSTVATGGALLSQSYGFAVDPTAGKLYWPNYGNAENRINGLGFVNLAGAGAGNITPQTAPFSGPQDLLVLKSPTGISAPVVSRAKSSRSNLICPTGGWATDFGGSFVYQAPTTYAYQWSLNGKAIAGATATTLKTTKPGRYTCTVTAANQAGAAAQASAAVSVKAAKAKLTTKKKVVVKAGGTAAFKLKITNQGDIEAKKARVCATLPKSAKGALKAPKCKPLKIKGHKKRSATLKIKALAAAGTYKVTFKVKGSAGKPVKSTIQVVG